MIATKEWYELAQEITEVFGENIRVLIDEQAEYHNCTRLEMVQWIDAHLTAEEAKFFLLDGVLPF